MIGRLLVWTLQTSGPTRRIWKLSPFLEELGACDFCVGFWVYSLMAWLFAVNILEPIQIPVLSECVTGLAISFVSHLASIGWRTRWGYEHLE